MLISIQSAALKVMFMSTCLHVYLSIITNYMDKNRCVHTSINSHVKQTRGNKRKCRQDAITQSINYHCTVVV